MPLRNHHKDWVLVLLLLVLLGAALYVIAPYLSAIFTGMILAYLLRPLYQWLTRVTKSKRAGGILLSIIAVTVFTGLLMVLITTFTTQATSAYDLTKTYLAHPDEEVVEYLSFVNTTKFKQQALTFLEEAPKRALPYTSKLINNLLNLFLFFTIAIFATAYFLINGKELRQSIIDSLPLRPQHKKQITARLDETIKAIVTGNIGTALLQGTISGVIFSAAGVPAALLLAFIITIAAFIPAIGPVIIWLPVTALLFIQGKTTTALIVAVLCATLLGYVDNFLKPKLIGEKIKLSSFIVFIAVLGGISAFGILGIFAGPLIFALLVTCADIYKKHIH